LKSFFSKGDIFGGLAASAVILPQATAFGIALWTPYGISAASAALAGLITTILLSLCSGLARGSAGMVSAPTGPTMVLVGGAMVTFYEYGYAAEQLVLLICLMLLISGAMQVAIGLSNGGRLIKFIPFPVVTGFISGSALLMILSQARLLELQNYQQFLQQPLWIPWLTAACSFVAMALAPRYWQKLPDTVAGLVFGTLVFHLLVLFSGVDAPDYWLVGGLPALIDLQILNPLNLNNIPWALVLPVSAALAVLAATNNMLTALVADEVATTRHNARRELTGQGIGQMLAALLGGIAGSGTTGATLVAVQSGGRTGVAVFVALLFTLAVLLLGSAAALLPVSVLAGLILNVAIMSMIKWDMFVWLKRRTTRLDGVTALLVVAATITYDLMVAIGVGLAVAIFQFVRAQIMSPVIHRRSNLLQRYSVRQRSDEQREIINKHADRVLIYELTGNLFFGTVDHLYEKLSVDLNRSTTLILDMARVHQVDLSAVRMFRQMVDRVHASGGEMVFTNVRKGKGLSRKVEKSLRRISAHRMGDYPIKTFIDADEAIEYAENKLLAQLDADPHATLRVELSEVSLFSDFDTEMIDTLQQYMTKVSIKSGDYLFHINDPGEVLYVVMEGDIDILLPYSDDHYKRVSKCGPGAFLGEIAFLKHGLRSADAKATADSELLKLDLHAFAKLREQHPDVAIKLLMRLGQELGRRLRHADDELRRLAS
jgi:sulfate permease, SulP family